MIFHDGEKKMNILVHLSNQEEAKDLREFLIRNGQDDVVVSGRTPVEGFMPHVILADVRSAKDRSLSRYVDAEVILIDPHKQSETATRPRRGELLKAVTG